MVHDAYVTVLGWVESAEEEAHLSRLIGLTEGQSMQWRGATGKWWTLRVVRVNGAPEAREEDTSAQP